ncbi:cytidylate kinase-like family protein [Desulfobacter hydrogenophilus]|uniref:Cytidylate kinase-like family protein n=1 Tax=Desulfobacter hydrogenophilus TaxID=2291 RepID=A0A328F845_9BACT|nr:cytidylate kinase-like family protein [Desulfobacter hydrogenophilus]NDY74147.1 cytidylate kinase-like family protein [Desulfobacter hydrogenophilus]QBH15331.1 cytidylate kinase-like family protein [Desulfobacter hydrogenophilus]RAM00801.1 cytidylate kinase-like family protein [Desulfobacter hydrogenophilus]
MSVITISRGSYSRGKEVAEKVASELGYKCISRDILLEASEEFNIPEIRLIRALHDAPSALERYTHGRERYVSYIRKALLQHIQKDNIVYHGLAGHYFLLDLPNVLKIRITSDIEERVKEEVRRENISEEKARYILKKDDDERRKWGLRLYGIDTWDSKLYDMVINIKNLSVEDAADLICRAVRKPNFKTTPKSEKMLDDALLAAKVHAALVKLSPKSIVTADDGVVRIGDPEVSLDIKNDAYNEIKKIAENVEGVKEVIISMNKKTDDHHAVNPFHNI